MEKQGVIGTWEHFGCGVMLRSSFADFSLCPVWNHQTTFLTKGVQKNPQQKKIVQVIFQTSFLAYGKQTENTKSTKEFLWGR